MTNDCLVPALAVTLLSLSVGAPSYASDASAGETDRAATSSSHQGQALFERHCAACHRERGFGTRMLSKRVPDGFAMLETRADLMEAFVSDVVRQGIGSMPNLRRAELSDAELSEIANYLASEEGEP